MFSPLFKGFLIFYPSLCFSTFPLFLNLFILSDILISIFSFNYNHLASLS
ncbi:hypothetical protein HOLDEFILI_02552 [Holdemania filiformis DSM 12042]|uniref:Uncharacterized protein n=1 Tax=Holdemania filiformis DSM 12042 TaxID=545696 RepID=B9Y9P5_9FIRM|nr:hypothetical protein HOLDEFILI_02552 [Holdemania filiformis DSM 12042]